MKNVSVSRPAGLMSVLLPVLALVMHACEKDPLRVNGGDLNFSRGVFVVNEGNFLSDNASLSFYDPANDTVYNQVFYNVNQSSLGDVANSMTIWNGKAYLPVNNSGRIYILDPASVKYLGKITGLSSPRYLEVIDETKAYVSDLYDNRIIIVHPTEFTITDSIDISNQSDFQQHTSERILLAGGKAFVGCWSYDNKVLVIDTGTDTLIDSIEVGKQPNSMVLDGNGDIWVLCDGGYPGSPYGQENASLWKIDPESFHGVLQVEFKDIDDSPADLCANVQGDTLFYLNGGVCFVGTGKLQEETLIGGSGKQFYTLGIDPWDNTLYVADAVDYQQNGWVYRYTLRGALLDSFRVGINPGHFSFLNLSQ